MVDRYRDIVKEYFGMGIGHRLKEYRRIKRIRTSTSFSEIIGISQGSLSDIENEKTFPSADTLKKIIKNTDINAHWLLTGEGSISREIKGKEEASLQTLHSLIQNYPDFRILCYQFVDILLYLKDKHWERRAFADLIDGFHDRIMKKQTQVEDVV
jgi:transcriptional regulator with XRE-family HTH domain